MSVQPLVDVRNLRVEFGSGPGVVVGVENVSFRIMPGETLCVVGESGSGKSVSALSMMRLVEFGGGEIASGTLLYQDREGSVDLGGAGDAMMRRIRGHRIGMIFQEPMTALNPVFTVERQLTEGLRVHLGMNGTDARERALELLRNVQIPEPEQRMKQYPHELSGGMRQRVVIAMAMACEPQLLICDEPTTALDVTVQAEILALINRLKREYGTAVMFITHDMAVVAQIADRVSVMYRGLQVEEGTVFEIFENPQHDYTRSLLAAVPKLGDMRGRPAPEPMKVLGATESARILETDTQERRVLLEVEGLTTRFPVRKGLFRRVVANVHSVEDVSFTICRGETLGLVGESGCGKSSCGRSILRLVEPLRGKVRLGGDDIIAMDEQGLRAARRNMQMVFQDPFASLNPQVRLIDQVSEPLRNYGLARGDELVDRVAALFDRGGTAPQFHETVSARAFRGAAPADCHRPRPGAESLAHCGGRGGLSTGCLGAGPGPEPHDGIAGRTGNRPAFHQSRHGRGRTHQPSHGGHVPGAHRGDRATGGRLREPATCIHEIPPVGRAGGRPAPAREPRGRPVQTGSLADFPGGA